MSKQILSVRDFSVIYNLILRQIEYYEKSPPWTHFIDESESEEAEAERKDALKTNPHYQDLLRLRDAIGTLNIEIETPGIEVNDNSNVQRRKGRKVCAEFAARN